MHLVRTVITTRPETVCGVAPALPTHNRSHTKGSVMPESSASVTVQQPLDIVWEYMSAPEHTTAYLPGTVEVTPLTDGPLAVGSQWKGKTAVLGRTVDWRGEFTRVDTCKETEFQTVEAPFPFTTRISLEETSDGVRVTCRITSSTGFGGVFGKMADPIVNRIYQRSLTASIESVPDLIEEWLAQQ
ncbi:Polyketide cyclase / dehydrase and lipid transport [Gordonia sp. v-85]|nr:Polyketide cyclase / dehydrase and lipid transport [Gordonia sp. v-85]